MQPGRLAVSPSNQARREFAVATCPVEDGLTFGSAEELLVYRALKRLQSKFPEHDTIAIAPLPGVRLRAGHTWSPDVLVTGPRAYPDHRNRRTASSQPAPLR